MTQNRRWRWPAWTALATVASLALAGCAETELAAHVASTMDTGGGSGHYKVGEPYEINGVWYTPEEDFHYDETGIASWYGPGFHGNSTANGERFDQNALTAAHPTLQMPSLVRVTNLSNGRSVVLRVNDRGPFIGNRIIDVSKRAAELLGFAGAGTAEVRVQVLTDESLDLAAEYGRGYAAGVAAATPERQVDHAELQRIAAASRGGQGAGSVPVAALPAQPASPVFVHAGSFASVAGAQDLANALAPIDNSGTVVEALVNGVPTYSVQLGPFDSPEIASGVLSRVIGAGYGGARIVR